jgi:hypothetical protein
MADGDSSTVATWWEAASNRLGLALSTIISGLPSTTTSLCCRHQTSVCLNISISHIFPIVFSVAPQNEKNSKSPPVSPIPLRSRVALPAAYQTEEKETVPPISAIWRHTSVHNLPISQKHALQGPQGTLLLRTQFLRDSHTRYFARPSIRLQSFLARVYCSSNKQLHPHCASNSVPGHNLDKRLAQDNLVAREDKNYTTFHRTPNKRQEIRISVAQTGSEVLPQPVGLE